MNPLVEIILAIAGVLYILRSFIWAWEKDKKNREFTLPKDVDVGHTTPGFPVIDREKEGDIIEQAEKAGLFGNEMMWWCPRCRVRLPPQDHNHCHDCSTPVDWINIDCVLSDPENWPCEWSDHGCHPFCEHFVENGLDRVVKAHEEADRRFKEESAPGTPIDDAKTKTITSIHDVPDNPDAYKAGHKKEEDSS